MSWDEDIPQANIHYTAKTNKVAEFNLTGIQRKDRILNFVHKNSIITHHKNICCNEWSMPWLHLIYWVENMTIAIAFIQCMSLNSKAQPISVVIRTGHTPQSLKALVTSDYVAVCRSNLTGATPSNTVAGSPYLQHMRTSRLDHPNHH